MTATEILPWLNMAIVPAVGLLVTINSRLARIETTMVHHADRLEQLQDVPAEVASNAATLHEHSRRLDMLRGAR